MEYTEKYDKDLFIKELNELIEVLEKFKNIPWDNPVYKGRGKAVREMKRYVGNGLEDKRFEISDTPKKCLEKLKRWGLY